MTLNELKEKTRLFNKRSKEIKATIFFKRSAHLKTYAIMFIDDNLNVAGKIIIDVNHGEFDFNYFVDSDILKIWNETDSKKDMILDLEFCYS